MYDKVFLKNGEIILQKSQMLKRFKKLLIIPLLFICGVLNYFGITKIESSLRYLIIPFSVICIVVYVFCYAGYFNKTNDIILRITGTELEYFTFKTYKISLEDIVCFKDESFYYDFPGNGPHNKGWQHKITVICKSTESTDNTISILDFNLKHNEFLKLIEYMSARIPFAEK